MTGSNQLSVWQRWVRQPQKVWLRRALFQVHLWSGITVGLYILMISVTGSVLVYRNELYRAATPGLIVSKGSGLRLRLSDPRSGSNPGNSVPTGIWLVSKLLDLHDNLLGGPTGRRVNG